ncbi:MAG: hypothetical protein GC137_08565 [Alphaproteobacteria bacterium]|nr:hypothetical protein [Alphaproteobacteria bacterium]
MSKLFAEHKDVGVKGGRYKGLQQDMSTAGKTSAIKTSLDARQALERIYARGEQQVSELRADPSIEGGSTATVGILTSADGKFTRGQTGDTLSVIFTLNKLTNERRYINLTVDQSPEAERERLESLGSRLGELYIDRDGDSPVVKFRETRQKATHIWTANDEAFSMARGFETSDSDGVIISTPDIQAYNVGELHDENTRVLVMVLSDGPLSDKTTKVLSLDDIAALIDADSSLEEIAARVIETAKERFAEHQPDGRSDNMTVTIGEYDPQPKEAIMLAVFDGHKHGGEKVASLLQQTAIEEVKLEIAPTVALDGQISQEFHHHAVSTPRPELDPLEKDYEDYIAGMLRRLYQDRVKDFVYDPASSRFEVTLTADANPSTMRAIGPNRSQLTQIGQTNGVARYGFTMADLPISLRMDTYREKHANPATPSSDAPAP